MENKKNTNRAPLSTEERIRLEADLAASQAQTTKLRKALKEDDAAKKAAEVPVVEEVTEEVAEAPVVEEEVAEEVAEAPVVEEVTEEVVDAPAEEVAEEAAEEVVEAPAEEVAEEATEEVAEAPVVEEEVAEEVAEAPVVEEEVAEEVAEAPVEEVEEAAEEEVVDAPAETQVKKPASSKKFSVGLLLGVIALVIAIIALILAFGSKNNDATSSNDSTTSDPGSSSVVEEIFDMEAFKGGVVNIASQYTVDEGIDANVDILCENIGEDKLVELVGKHGELSVQKGLAELLAFAPEVKMNQYISNNALDYNPNAADDYSQYLDAADVAYTEATGKNPNGALMSLEGYDTYKSNRDAMKALIIETGDFDLLTWYEAKTEGYDLMLQQERDTEAALAYKETVKTELLSSQGTADLLALQLEQVANGTLTVVDNASMQYTEEYNNFIINNYIYVIAK